MTPTGCEAYHRRTVTCVVYSVPVELAGDAMTQDDETPRARADLGAVRLLLGLAQGVALLLLVEAQSASAWPATDPWLWGTLTLIVAFVPPTVLVGVGQLRPLTLAAWVAGAVGLIVVAASHAIARAFEPATESIGPLFLLLSPALFAAYHLVAASDADGRVPASYRSYFDIAWKNGVQLTLSLAFVLGFWLLLRLGALLFELIKISLFGEIIGENWFIFPVIATVFALAVHVTDVRIGLINGIRAVSLVLLSWLLPVMTVLAVAFLAALPATGLTPLWDTGSATAIVLVAAATLVVLINAAYQDGGQETAPHWVLQIAARVAGVALVPLVLIAGYSVWLRVGQHGLTPERVVALGILAVAACYAGGYAIAAAWPGRWFKPLEITNIVAALVSLGLLVSMLTSIADPARIAVDDQVRRLRAGLVAPETFDYQFLRFHAARYGRDALQTLARDKSSPRAQAIAAKAQETLDYNASTPAPPPPPAKDLIAQIVVRPSGKLPESFVNQDWSKGRYAPTECARMATATAPCTAFFVDFEGDGTNEILIGATGAFTAYQLSPDGRWRWIGYFEAQQCGVYLPNFLEAGRFQFVQPKQRELEIEGQRLRLQGCAE